MKFDLKTTSAIVLCIVLFVGYDYYLRQKYPDYYKRREAPAAPASTEPVPAASAAPGASAVTAGTPGEASRPALLASDQLRFETDTSIYTFSQITGGLESIQLKRYKKSAARDEQALVQIFDQPLQVVASAQPRREDAAVPLFHAERKERGVAFWHEQAGLKVVQEYRLPSQGYGLDLEVTYLNQSQQAIDLLAYLTITERVTFPKSKSLLGFLPGGQSEVISLVTAHAGSTKHLALAGECEDGGRIGDHSGAKGIEYFGIDRHYFVGALIPSAKTLNFEATATPLGGAGCRVNLAVSEPQGLLAPGQSAKLSFKGYFGPKDLPILASVDQRLESAVDFGVFSFLATPLLLVIRGFNQVFNNYGLAIVLLTLCLKVLFYPLLKASTESGYRMRELQPQVKAMQERYKDDRAKLNEEMMKFYSRNGVNPMKGCLPMLPTIPVFFAFYQVLAQAIELRHAPFYGWINDLASMDAYLITPLLLGVAMFIQQKLTPTTGMDKTQEKILMFMPVMFTFMMLTLPAGLTLYMLTNTVVGLVQTKWLYHKLDAAKAGSKKPEPPAAGVKAR